MSIKIATFFRKLMIYFVSLKFSIQILQTLSYKKATSTTYRDSLLLHIIFEIHVLLFQLEYYFRLYLYIFNHHCNDHIGEFKSNRRTNLVLFLRPLLILLIPLYLFSSKSHTINFSNFPCTIRIINYFRHCSFNIS